MAISRDNAYIMENIDLTTAMTFALLEVRNLHKSLFINIVFGFMAPSSWRVYLHPYSKKELCIYQSKILGQGFLGLIP